MSHPRIAVTKWEDVPGEKLQLYWDGVRRAGADVVDLGPEDSLEFDGLVLTGGIDVDPSLYGEARHPKVRHVDPSRDAYELTALRHALREDLTVLAICRGHQLLNVALGGKLLQHVEGDGHRAHREQDLPSRWHTIQIERGSRLSAVYLGDEMEVNSRHHQAALPSMLPDSLRAVAYSPEGLVEGVESKDHGWVVGVQWHPERLEIDHPGFAERNAALFQAFVAATRRVREPA